VNGDDMFADVGEVDKREGNEADNGVNDNDDDQDDDDDNGGDADGVGDCEWTGI
jgi:hypothetical protein